MQCAICGSEVLSTNQHVATSEGGVVHLHCAEQEAALAWAQRRQRALIQGAVLGVAVIAAYLLIGKIVAAIWLGMLLLIAHIASNRRWWHYMLRDVIAWMKQVNLWRERR